MQAVQAAQAVQLEHAAARHGGKDRVADEAYILQLPACVAQRVFELYMR